MSRRPLLRRGAARAESGMTLLEIMVAMMILSVALAIVFSVLISLQNDEVTVSSRHAANQQAQLITYSLSRQVHAAATPSGMSSPFVIATATELKFYSALGNSNGPTQLDIHAVPACAGCSTMEMVEDMVQPTLVGGLPSYTGSSQRVVLGSGLVVPVPTPSTDCSTGSPGIFQYYSYLASSSGTCLVLDTSQSPPAVASSQFARIDSIHMTITTEDPGRPTTSSQSEIALDVSLPNVDYANA